MFSNWEKKGKKVYGEGSKGMRQQVGDKSTYSTLCHSMAYVMTELTVHISILCCQFSLNCISWCLMLLIMMHSNRLLFVLQSNRRRIV